MKTRCPCLRQHTQQPRTQLRDTHNASGNLQPTWDGNKNANVGHSLIGLFAAVCFVSGISWARPLPDGLDITIDDETYVVQVEWTVLITIDVPQPPPELLNFTQHLHNTLSHKTMSAWTLEWQGRLHVRDPVDGGCRVPAAGREILHYLLGTATDDIMQKGQ